MKAKQNIVLWNTKLNNLAKDYKHKCTNYHYNRTNENRIARNEADALYTREMARQESWKQH